MKRFLRNERGGSSAEYILILAILGAGVAGGSAGLATSLSGAFETAGAAIGSIADDLGGGPAGGSGANGGGPPADPGNSGNAGPPANPGNSGNAGPPANPGNSGNNGGGKKP